MSLKVVFMGTPESALPVLERLHHSSHSVIHVITAPDRPRGRGLTLSPTPVKVRASEMGVPVTAVTTLKEVEVQSMLRGFAADVFVVTAFGLILPRKVLEIPPKGSVNVHFSLLPRLRGAAPVQRAIIEGYSQTGVTIMRMDEGLDTGPVYASAAEPILEKDTAGTLQARLGARGSELLIDVLDSMDADSLEPVPQDDSIATFAPKVTTAEALIDWARPAESIHNLVRALDPKPGAWTNFRGRRLKIWRAAVTDDDSAGFGARLRLAADGALQIGTGSKFLMIVDVQPEGRKRMAGEEFIRGYRPLDGEELK